MDMIPDIDWNQTWFLFYHLILAFLLALPLGWDREYSAEGIEGAGLRTFPLVAVGSCAYMLTGISVLETSDAEARVMYGILTGIGFIGGGAILKNSGSVAGTATAASIWNTGAIGVAVAWDRYDIAMVLSVLNFLTFRFMPLFKKRMRRPPLHPNTKRHTS